ELRVAPGTLMSAPLKRIAHGHGISDHADWPRLQVTPQVEHEQQPWILDSDRLAGDRPKDLVAPAVVAPAGAYARRGVPPSAAASLQDPVVEPVELADLTVAARVEAVLLRNGAELDAVVRQHAGDRRGAAAVHPQNNDDSLVAQLRGRPSAEGKHLALERIARNWLIQAV